VAGLNQYCNINQGHSRSKNANEESIKAKFATGYQKITVFAMRHPKIVNLFVDTVKK
jgi:hypothetical protein